MFSLSCTFTLHTDLIKVSMNKNCTSIKYKTGSSFSHCLCFIVSLLVHIFNQFTFGRMTACLLTQHMSTGCVTSEQTFERVPINAVMIAHRIFLGQTKGMRWSL